MKHNPQHVVKNHTLKIILYKAPINIRPAEQQIIKKPHKNTNKAVIRPLLKTGRSRTQWQDFKKVILKTRGLCLWPGNGKKKFKQEVNNRTRTQKILTSAGEEGYCPRTLWLVESISHFLKLFSNLQKHKAADKTACMTHFLFFVFLIGGGGI